jgi:protein gp37
MGSETGIAWTNATFNPWWGCTKFSSGCKNCYAETWAARWGNDIWGDNAGRKLFGAKHWNEPRKWNREAEAEGVARLVFCGSMCDIMEGRDDLNDERKKLYKLVEETPFLTWQFLTKRPENYAKYLPAEWLKSPRENIWLMTTVEDNDNRWRADELIKLPAKVRGLSVEPMVGPVDLDPKVLSQIDWVIIGGESGAGARVCCLEWEEKLIADCRACGVKIFVKQLGSMYSINGVVSNCKGKNAELSEMPVNLRIRETPALVA